MARETGDYPFLAALQPIQHFETGADRQRMIYRDTGDWKAVVADMKQQWAQELEAAGATK